MTKKGFSDNLQGFIASQIQRNGHLLIGKPILLEM